MLLVLSAVAVLVLPASDPTVSPEGQAIAAETAKVLDAAKAREAKLEAKLTPLFKGIKTDADQEAFDRTFRAAALSSREANREAIRVLMSHLRKSAADPAAVRGLVYAANEGDDAIRDEAGVLLRRHHLNSRDVLIVAENPWGLAGEDWVEPLIRALLAEGVAPADHRARLRYALARHLHEKAEEPAKVEGWTERTEIRYGLERVAQIRKRDVKQLEAESLKLFEALAADKVKEELVPGVTLSEAARSAIREIRDLGIGKPAPEIVAEDLDGLPMRLSDYRGKVVVLTFWHSRCGPCLQFAREERTYAERFASRPFAPVGVNVDDKREPAKEAAEKHKLAWRSFWCGPKGGFAEIPRAWNVEAWPTIFVIDHNGLIRSKTARGPELRRLLDRLVEKAEADSDK